MNRTLPFLAISLVAATSALSAVDDMHVRNLENRVSALEQTRGVNRTINPPARPVVKDGVNLWIQAEALYMRATEDSVSYAIKSQTVIPPLNGRVKNIAYDWSWGWRAGAGYNLPHDGWDMLFNYTGFKTSASKSSTATPPKVIYQTLTAALTGASLQPVTEGKAHISLNFDYLDFQLGREFFVSKWLTLRPYVGGRGLWVYRHLKAAYQGGQDLAGDNVSKVNIKLNNRFRGGGLLTGLDSQWGLGRGWSFYGQLALSLLYGSQNLYENQNRISLSGVKTLVAHIHDTWTIVRFMADLGAGLRWDHLFFSDAYRIRLQIGWEQHLLSGFDKDINFTNASTPGKFVFNEGDLSLSGLTFQARFDF